MITVLIAFRQPPVGRSGPASLSRKLRPQPHVLEDTPDDSRILNGSFGITIYKMIPDIPILIVGAQLSGLSAAYHLHNEGINKDDIYFFDALIKGKASQNWIPGTQGPELPRHTKFVSVPDDSSYSSLSHSRILKMGAQQYLRLKRNGVWLQREIAEAFNKNLVRNLGTVVLSNPKDENKLLEEFHLYKELGFESTLNEFNQESIERVFSTSEKSFTRGLFVPDDFIIDIEGYVNALASLLPETHFLNGHIVDKIEDRTDHVIVDYSIKHRTGDQIKIEKQQPITAGKVVFATNGFFVDSNLRHLLRQYWNYVLCFKDEGKNTPNAFYFGRNGHYFTRQDNILIVGGEDTLVDKNEFSIPNNRDQALEKLLNWSNETFPKLSGTKPLGDHYGVFCETVDNLPIVGKFDTQRNVYYIVGCNGDGQSALSYSAYLLPAIMGIRKPRSKDEKDYIDLISPNRPTLRPR